MKIRKNGVRASALTRATTVRASISFPSEVYRSLEKLAKEHKVSLAWVVRDAAEQYVAAKTAAANPATAK
jgi:predicted transcriptional regulator